MNQNTEKICFLRIKSFIILFFLILVGLLAWITYGTLEGIVGMLSYLIIGFVGLYPWIIPYVGIVFGFLDLFNVLNIGLYSASLEIARLSGSWMSVSWFCITSLLGIIINLIFSLYITIKLRDLKNREKSDLKNYALKNCNIINGKKNSDILHNGIILIDNSQKDNNKEFGIIEAIGREGEIEIPKDYDIIDLRNKYILPGLINAHCHLTGSGKPMKIMNLSDEMMEFGSRLLKNKLVQFILKRILRKNALTALNAGITTLRSMGDPEYLDVKLRKEIEKGGILGPRLLVSGPGICTTGGHGGPMSYVADSVAEIRKAVRKNLRNEVDLIKILSTGGVMDARNIGEAGRPQMTVEEISTACSEAHRGGLLVATHCESTKGIKEALKGGVDTVEHGAEIPDDLVPLFKENPKSLRGYTALISTLSAGMGLATLEPEVTKITDVKFENAKLIEQGMIQGFRKAYKKGIKIGCGTDASVPFSTHYNFWKELLYYTKYSDMSTQEAIHMGTLNNAKILGIDHITGSIEKGKSADLIVVPENPYNDIEILSNVERIFIRGHFIKNPEIKKVKDVEKVPFPPLEI